MASINGNATKMPACCWVIWVLKSHGCRFAKTTATSATAARLAVTSENGILRDFFVHATDKESRNDSSSDSYSQPEQTPRSTKYIWELSLSEYADLEESGLLNSELHELNGELGESTQETYSSEHSFNTNEWLRLLKTLLANHETPTQTIQIRNDNISTADVIQSILSAYQTSDVRIHMAGCHFELRPWLVTVEIDALPSDQTGEYSEPMSTTVDLRFFDYAATALTQKRIIELALNRWSPDALTMQSHEKASFVDWSQKISESDKVTLYRTIVWSRWAHGRVSFETDQNEQHVEFSGWAHDFVETRLKPPSLTCPETGEKSYHVCATADGVISNDKAFANCAVSGKRDLKSRLIKCDHCEAHASEEFIAKCPVSGERIIQNHLAKCRTCQQPTSPTLITRDTNHICPACIAADEQIQFANKSDVERFENALPIKQQDRNWRIATRGSRTIAISSNWFQKFRIVEESGKIVGAFVRPGLFHNWKSIDATSNRSI